MDSPRRRGVPRGLILASSVLIGLSTGLIFLELIVPGINHLIAAAVYLALLAGTFRLIPLDSEDPT